MEALWSTSVWVDHGVFNARVYRHARGGGALNGSVRDVFEPRRVLGGGLSNRLTTRLQPMVTFMRDNPMAGE